MNMRTLLMTIVAVGLAGAALAQNLVVYNAGSSELIEDTVKAFNAHHPEIKVTVVSAGVGQLTTRIQAEAKNPRGDVFFGASVESFENLLDLLAPYTSPNEGLFNPKFIQADHKYYGYSQPLQAFVVNTDMMPLDKAPQSWADLADPAFAGKIIMANPSMSGSAYAQLAQMLQLHGWDLVEGVVRNTQFVTSSQLVFENVARGEIEVGITGEANIAMLINDGWPVGAIYPSEGTGLRFDAMGIIAGGPNPDSAKVFMDFATTVENANIAAAHFRRSVLVDADAPIGLAPTSEIPTFPYDPEMASTNRDSNLAKFDEIFSNR